jgi:peptidoglycan/LPS O-acetylase OafA/YrhL
MNLASTLRIVALAALTPLLEKNVLKTVALDTPVVFSMSRVIVLAFAVGMLKHIWHAGVAGWPDAMLAIAVVLALPILGALERLDSQQVVDFATSLARRLGD